MEDAKWCNEGFAHLFGKARGDAVETNYYMILVQTTNETNIDNAAAVDKGTTPATVGIPVTAHGYQAGDGVLIQGSDNYDGYYVVEDTTSTNEIVITAAYTAETFDGGGAETVRKGPGPRTATVADLTEIPNGNGYTTGGIQLALNTTDFPTLTITNTASGNVIMVVKNLTWTASGGSIPANPDRADVVVLTGHHATISARKTLAYAWLKDRRQVSDGQPLNVNTFTLKLSQG